MRRRREGWKAETVDAVAAAAEEVRVVCGETLLDSRVAADHALLRACDGARRLVARHLCILFRLFTSVYVCVCV